MSAIVSLAGWTFLPGFITTFIHNQLVTLLPDRIAQPGSTNYTRDRRIIYTLVILSYLLYTLFAAFSAVGPNYYELIGVPINVTEKALRTKFRRLSAVLHPDKGGSETAFLSLRTAYDVLSIENKRRAYDRFGPQVTHWNNAVLNLDYMFLGLQTSLPFYVGALFFISILGWINKATYGSYWRGLAIISLASLHFNICARPGRPWIMESLLPSKVQFEYVSLLQSLTITLLIAIAQVGPALFPDSVPVNQDDLMREVCALADVTKVEAIQAMKAVHSPFARGTTKTAELYDVTAVWLERQRIYQDPAVQEAFQAARARQAT